MKIDLKKLKEYALRAVMAAISTYAALFLVEALLWRMEPKTYRELYKGLYDVKDGNAVLKPGYRGGFDLRGEHIETIVNSYGYRGHEPASSPKSRVLLLGDSFAFGALLDQKDIISTRMEENEPGLEVINTGVIGYNLPQQLNPLRDWPLPADQVVYLFFYNDFEPPIPELTLLNGVAVLRRHADGTLVSDEEARATGDRLSKRDRDPNPFSLLSSVRLPRARQFVLANYHRVKDRDSSEPVNWWPQVKDQANMVKRALASTLEMRGLAVKRNMRFQIAIAPGIAEVKDQKHFPQVTEYIEALRGAGIPVLDLLPKLSASDYFSFDPHFNAKGAKIAADEISKSLKVGRASVK